MSYLYKFELSRSSKNREMDSHWYACAVGVVFAVVLLTDLSHSASIDQIIADAAESPEALDFLQDDVGTVKVELDMLFTREQWQEIQELNNTSIEDIRTKRKAVRPLNYRWTGKTIPYTIDRNRFSSRDQQVIQTALNEWMRYTCVKFRPATRNDRNRINFQDGGGCSSFVGMLGRGSQPVTLGYGCRQKGVVIHEVGHAIGFHHEQTRPDRDAYVTIQRQNIPPSVLFNFQKYSTGVINTYSVPYDYKSIMHYGATAFSTNGRRTIVTKDPRFQNVIGNRQGLSFRDIKLASTIYNCAESCPRKSCPGEGFVGKDCKCWCPGNPVRDCDGGSVVTTARPPRPTTTRRPTTRRPTTRRPTTQRPTGNCIDTNQHCASWAAGGECQKNPNYMLSYCKKSCNRCSGGGGVTVSCTDLRSTCSYWVRAGFCRHYSYSSFMKQNCRRSCNYCGSSSAATAGSTRNCVDYSQHCNYWKNIGECQKNPNYMLKSCPKSCNSCNSG